MVKEDVYTEEFMGVVVNTIMVSGSLASTHSDYT
jgi:hypothetical protein